MKKVKALLATSILFFSGLVSASDTSGFSISYDRISHRNNHIDTTQELHLRYSSPTQDGVFDITGLITKTVIKPVTTEVEVITVTEPIVTVIPAVVIGSVEFNNLANAMLNNLLLESGIDVTQLTTSQRQSMMTAVETELINQINSVGDRVEFTPGVAMVDYVNHTNYFSDVYSKGVEFGYSTKQFFENINTYSRISVGYLGSDKSRTATFTDPNGNTRELYNMVLTRGSYFSLEAEISSFFYQTEPFIGIKYRKGFSGDGLDQTKFYAGVDYWFSPESYGRVMVMHGTQYGASFNGVGVTFGKNF